MPARGMRKRRGQLISGVGYRLDTVLERAGIKLVCYLAERVGDGIRGLCDVLDSVVDVVELL